MMFWDDVIWESWRERFRKTGEEKPGYRSQLEFATAVLEAQFRAWEGLDSPKIAIPESEGRTRLKSGFVLVDRRDLPEISVKLHDLVRELADIVAARKPEMREEAEAFLAAAASGTFRTGVWLAGILRNGEGRGEAAVPARGLSDHLAGFLSFSALRPLWMRVAESSRPHLKDGLWELGSCPVCAQPAAVGELRGEEGSRYLVCTRCGTDWIFPRIRCASCDNTEISTLKYLYSDEEPGYRVDVCEKCRTMLKVMDARTLPQPLVAEVEDLITPHLNYLAMREGYHRKSPNILGLQ
jgi:FdhE protein